jgi:hypothetical protein
VLQARSLPVGTLLTSQRFSYQTSLVVQNGYRRNSDNGRIEFFRRDGRLREVVDKNGNSILLSYDVPGQTRMQDNEGHTITLFLNAQMRVTRIGGSQNRTCEYRYNDRQEISIGTQCDKRPRFDDALEALASAPGSQRAGLLSERAEVLLAQPFEADRAAHALADARAAEAIEDSTYHVTLVLRALESRGLHHDYLLANPAGGRRRYQ